MTYDCAYEFAMFLERSLDWVGKGFELGCDDPSFDNIVEVIIYPYVIRHKDGVFEVDKDGNALHTDDLTSLKQVFHAIIFEHYCEPLMDRYSDEIHDIEQM